MVGAFQRSSAPGVDQRGAEQQLRFTDGCIARRGSTRASRRGALFSLPSGQLERRWYCAAGLASYEPVANVNQQSELSELGRRLQHGVGIRCLRQNPASNGVG